MSEIKIVDSNFQKYCKCCRDITEHTVKLTKNKNYYWYKCSRCGDNRYNLIKNGLRKW
nr:MAG: Zn finger protein [uncultured archaeon]